MVGIINRRIINLLNTFNKLEPDQNRMLDIDTDDAIIFGDLFVRYNSINALQYYFRLGIVIIIESIISAMIIKRILHKLRGNYV
jgi:hypothetical protein